MEGAKTAIEFLKSKIDDKEKRGVLNFEEFLELLKAEPQRVLRNIFQLFHDMVKFYVPPGINEYPDDPESIGYLRYDCSKIFAEGADNPFFPDRLLANRFVKQVDDMRRGSQQNMMHVYEGPPGCGKSTFLNNLLRKFEEYTSIKDGQSFELFWAIDMDSQKVEIPCPSHDHPILVIPKKYRADFLKNWLAEDSEEAVKIKRMVLNDKEYEWIFKEEPCTICKSIFWNSLEKFGSIDKLFSMIKVRPYKFDRRLGEGISVFNPGDKPLPLREQFVTDKQIQEKLDHIFGPNVVRYIFSPLARTNNGIYVLMDVKSNNQERIVELHNVISEGVHKVIDIEERVKSFFLALMNPEDRKILEGKEEIKSLQGRIQYGTISYVLEPETEAKIYRSIFGDHIDSYFLPRILSNFARVIISSRMGTDSKALKEWIKDSSKYEKYCDRSGILLRMEIYSGIIPTWLSEDDKKNFAAQVRRKIITEAESEGNKGFSGRDSIKLFSDFLSIYLPKSKMINMGHVSDFFKNRIGEERRDRIPNNFIDSLLKWYNFTVLNEVKESLYFYNKDQIREDILHFFCAINEEPGNKVKCKYTGKEIEVTVDFLKMVASYIRGRQVNDKEALNFAQETQKKYVEMVARDREKPITETDLYQNFFNSYVRNLKEKVLQPFLGNENFREAVKAFGSKEFEAFDTRIKEHISYMIKNLISKFGYTESGAKEVCLYVLNEKIAETFS